jgi:hypothetical protein
MLEHLANSKGDGASQEVVAVFTNDLIQNCNSMPLKFGLLGPTRYHNRAMCCVTKCFHVLVVKPQISLLYCVPNCSPSAS